MDKHEKHELARQFGNGRGAMIDAFVAVSQLARKAGADPELITEAHGLFFDGNVTIKAAQRALGIGPI